MPRRNRVDPWGDLHAVASRGLFTGNRGCVVDDHERVVRHHGSSLWITCVTRFRDWRFPLARPRRWTPLFFLDEGVALAAGHRPCATCRRAHYTAYRDAVTRAIAAPSALLGAQLNERLQAERHRRGRGLARAGDRILWSAPYAELPDGTVVVAPDRSCQLVVDDRLLRFSFDGWVDPAPRPRVGEATVLTPPTSVAALAHGYPPRLHPSALAFTFAEMTEADLPQLHRWFEQAHVRAFYDREPRTLEGVAATYRAKILGDEPTRPFIASLAGTAIGYLQAYRIADYPAYARAIDVGPDTAGVDLLIGEPAYAHRGLGAALLRQFVDEVVWELTGATACWIGPAVHNAIAIRCYEKAGFVYVKTVHVPGEHRPEHLMRLERPRPSG